jgi:hypothetical protein
MEVTMDTNRIRELLDRRDDIDRELAVAVGSLTPPPISAPRRQTRCGSCGQDGHTARHCTAQRSDTIIESSSSPASPGMVAG